MTYCTGGTVTYSGGKRIHTFTTDGTLVVVEAGNLEVLMVGGGGACGGGACCIAYPAGGAGGSYYYSASEAVTAGNKSIVIGVGGGPAENYPGGNTTFNGRTANGGGSGYYATGSPYGHGGNNSHYSGGIMNGNYNAGGGAGAGGAGGAADGIQGGNGGAAYSNSISGSSRPYSAGGGGGSGGTLGSTPASDYGRGGYGNATVAGQNGVVIVSYTPTQHKSLTAGITPSGAMTVTKRLHACSGAMTPAGSLIRKAMPKRSGAMTPAGSTAAWHPNRVPMAGALSYAMRYSKSLGGEISTGFWGHLPGTAVKSWQYALIDTITGEITNWYFAAKGFLGEISEIAGEIRYYQSRKNEAGSMDSAGAITGRAMTSPAARTGGVLAPLGTLYDLVQRALYGTIASSGAIRYYIKKKAVAGAITPTGAQANVEIQFKHLNAAERPLHLTSNRRGERIRREY